jgi:hypothetical protein
MPVYLQVALGAVAVAGRKPETWLQAQEERLVPPKRFVLGLPALKEAQASHQRRI